MIRSSALYISLIVSILIVLVCGSLLLIGFTYRLYERQHARMITLAENLDSGTLMVLQKEFEADTSALISLYGNSRDSVLIEKQSWGIYEIGMVKSWISSDTASSIFLIGTALADSSKVLYVTDEDRPVSITGESMIKGTAYLPKSGIKPAYIDTYGYKGKTLVHGTIKHSGRQLPLPDMDIIRSIAALRPSSSDTTTQLPDSITNSFFDLPVRIHFVKELMLSPGFSAAGKVILSSDSAITVSASSSLDKVLLMAPQVTIQKGFKGNLQIFATDSIIVEDSVMLAYPSALVLLKNDTAKFQARIRVGKGTGIEGQLFAFEKERSLLMPVISVGERSSIKGEIWCQGYVGLGKKAKVKGAVSAIRLMASVNSAIYENYLIDVQLDKKALSRYYLSSGLLNPESKERRLLCKLD